MTRTMRVCRLPGCGTLTTHGLCREHRLERDNSKNRGYTGQHRQLRAQWATIIATQGATCTRCGDPIYPGDPWDLGHTNDRTRWRGPEHMACNRATRAHTTQGG